MITIWGKLGVVWDIRPDRLGTQIPILTCITLFVLRSFPSLPSPSRPSTHSKSLRIFSHIFCSFSYLNLTSCCAFWHLYTLQVFNAWVLSVIIWEVTNSKPARIRHLWTKGTVATKLQTVIGIKWLYSSLSGFSWKAKNLFFWHIPI